MKRFWGGRKRWLVALVVLAGVGLLAWAERTSLHTWWAMRGLRQAEPTEVVLWAERLADLDQAALPPLMDWLVGASEADEARIDATLQTLARRWPADDPRQEELAQRLTRTFDRLPRVSQCAALNLARNWLEAAPQSERTTLHAGRLLVVAAHQSDPAVQNAALRLALPLLHCRIEPEAHCAVRSLARQGLRVESVERRILAAELASKPSLDLLPDLVPLLRDPTPEVRRVAIQALGSAPRILSTDALLPVLHDPDEAVRLLCERALRQRGLTSDYVRLARLITDSSWSRRLEVLDHLEDAADIGLDPVVWLRRLTYDPAPAVRVAAIRAASEAHLRQLADRLDQMARDDPSSTVSELARHYQQAQVGKPSRP